MKYCSKCGSEVLENDNFCSKCGSPLTSSDNLNEENLPQNSQLGEPETTTSRIKQKDNSSIVLFIFVVFSIICIAHTLHTPSEKKTSDNKTETKIETNITQKTRKDINIDFKPYLVYRQENQGIYVFKIKKEKFNKNAFLNYAQTLSKSPKGDSNFIFVFDKNVKTTPIDDMVVTPPYNIPLYTTDILWKQKPYFYYSDAFGLKQSYCEITGLEQKYYERNKGLLYKETAFSHKYNLTAPEGFGLSSLNGCNPEYVADPATIQQEMNLVTISSMGLQSIAQDKAKQETSNDNLNNIQTQEGLQDVDGSDNSKFAKYMQDVGEMIKISWVAPHLEEPAKAIMSFSVSKSGSLIGKPTVKESSGIKVFDDSCINALELAAPFPPLPQETEQDSVSIDYTFETK